MRSPRHRKVSLIRSALVGGLLMGLIGCSRDMADQPSFQPQEAPRLHSPVGSVPRRSREALTTVPSATPALVSRGAALFEINCSHCHGKSGLGNGPVAAHLVEPPANLRSKEVQTYPAPEIYEIVTRGQGLMPAFKGELSAEERWAVAYFVKSFEAGTNRPDKG